MSLINRLLRKNMSPARIAGFVLSNFIGLAIVVAGLQFFQDVRSIYTDEDSFIRKDFLVVNKKVTSANTVDGRPALFTPGEIAGLESQPWVRKVGRFSTVDYRVSASVEAGGRGMSTSMFFESIPSEFIDVAGSGWEYRPGSLEVPVIMSKDYLTLYNFGFASSAGFPQLSEQFMGGIPLRLRITSDDGMRRGEFAGRVVGFSNRLNTILVPEEFMEWSNREFGSGGSRPGPSRLIVDVSSPGDVAIAPYLEEHGMEAAGDKRASQASFLLNVVTGVILAVGVVITVLSFFILLLSVSILMEKNRDKIHTLLMLGYPLGRVASPYRKMILWSCLGAYVLAVAVVYCFRLSYLHELEGLGGGGEWWLAPTVGLLLTLAVVALNVVAVGRRVRAAWRVSR